MQKLISEVVKVICILNFNNSRDLADLVYAFDNDGKTNLDLLLEDFISEIVGNLEEVVDPEYVFVKMRSSMIEENVYVEEEDSEENIWYLKFFIDTAMWGDEGYVCGDGSRFAIFHLVN